MKNLIPCIVALSFILFACQENESVTQENSSANFNELKLERFDIDFENNLHLKSAAKHESFDAIVEKINEELLDYNVQLEKMELYGYEETGRTVVFKEVGNKQAPSDYVPNDPRNFFPGTDLPVWTDGTEQGTESGMSPDETKSAIYSAINTWNSVDCSEDLNIVNLYTTTPEDIYNDVGVIQRIFGFGGAGWRIYGSILHGGNLPAAFFEALREGGGEGTLGVTFTFIFIDADRVPTDIDNNGRNDVAFREIYINASQNFQDAPDDVMFNGIVDYETVVLHEMGHGLSQTHFGKSFIGRNGKIHFAPYALMNSGYSMAQRTITATDKAGHCSIWDTWPYE